MNDLLTSEPDSAEIDFEQIVRRHAGPMLAVARRFLRCEADAADAVQDAFLSAYRALDRFEGSASFGTWLHRIVVNACLMKLRRQSRRSTVPIDDLLPTFDDTGHHARPVRDWDENAVSALSRDETRARVRACIAQLPASYREVLVLRDIEELDTAETARVLEMSCGAVKTRLHRARQALRTLLAPMMAAE